MKRFFIQLIVFLVLAPLAAMWAFYQERRISKIGKPLEQEMQMWATSVGIKNPSRIRMSIERSLHFPSPKWLKNPLEKRGLCLNTAAGMCLRYGIFIHQNANLTDRLLKHELAHTLQYERHGSMFGFMRQYLFECLYFGYEYAPMEDEAE